MKTLELNQMENVNGGLEYECPFPGLADGLAGAAMVIGFASWWTGAGAGFALAVSGGAYVADLAGC